MYFRFPLDDMQDYPIHKQKLALAKCVLMAENYRRRLYGNKHGSYETAAQYLGTLDHMGKWINLTDVGETYQELMKKQ